MTILKKILINTSNLNTGGGLQVALSFINEAVLANKQCDYQLFFTLSHGVFSELSKEVLDKINYTVFETSPTKLKAFKERKTLDKIVRDFSPDIVFSIFGPTYWRPKNVIHFVGFAQAWLLFARANLYKRLPKVSAIKRILLNRIQSYSFRRHSDYIVAETKTVANAVQVKLHFSANQIFVVPNTASSCFFVESFDHSILDRLPIKKTDTFYFLLLANAHPHKNIGIIRELLELLPKNYMFIITTSDDFYRANFSNTSRVVNVGFVDNKDCPALYKYADALFLPTFLECFSANYPESFAMGKPVFTSDLDFARGVCQEAAFYFDPYDAKDVANSLIQIEKKLLVQQKILSGKQRLCDFLTAKSRMQTYFAIIDQIIKDDNL